MKFKYTAVDKFGKEIKGIEEAQDMQAAASSIRSKGYLPIKIAPAAETAGALFSSRGTVKMKTTAMATRQLATLTEAGLPLVRSLKVLGEQQPAGNMKKIFNGLVESIEGGSSLSDALARYPNVFSRLYVNMVKAGESAGLVDLILNRLADYYEKGLKLKSKIVSALIYPCIVLCMAFTILIGLMIFIVPKFAEMFADMNMQLPLMTSILIFVSKSMITIKFWGIIAFLVIIIKASLGFIKKSSDGRYFMDKMWLKLPFAGTLIRKLAVARFARTLGTLVSSGVPILGALNTVKETVSNEVLAKGLSTVYSSIKEGESIVPPLRQVEVFDSVVINMIAVGEETGKLDEMLIKVADIYDDEVDVAVANVTSVLEPLLIVSLAVVVGFIVISLFLPLIKLLTTLSSAT